MNIPRIKTLLICAIGLFLGACTLHEPPAPANAVPAAVTPAGRWILIDTAKRELDVFENTLLIAKFDHIALGSSGAGIKHKRGDNITPLGTFAVEQVRSPDKFGTFILLNYPSREYALSASRDGVIDQATFNKMNLALERGELPAQNTNLGGDIGIHGIGKGSLAIHRSMDWTDGCVALTNSQIKQLAALVKHGMIVVIR